MKLIGDGGFGKVYRYYDSKTASYKAIKSIQVTKNMTFQEILNELMIIYKLTGHPNVV